MRTPVWRRAACRCNPSFRSHLHALRPFVWYFIQRTQAVGVFALLLACAASRDQGLFALRLTCSKTVGLGAPSTSRWAIAPFSRRPTW
jgi:hypothetical protein